MPRSEAEWQAIARYLDPIIMGKQLDAPILRQIPGDCLADIWPLIGLRIEQLVERSRGRWTLDGICERIMDDRWQLWMVWDGKMRAIVGTQISQEMSGMKIANIVFTTGSNPERWVSLVAEIEEWARLQGCDCVEAIARPGWGKHLTHYRKTHIILARGLTDARQQTNDHRKANHDAVDVGAVDGHRRPSG